MTEYPKQNLFSEKPAFCTHKWKRHFASTKWCFGFHMLTYIEENFFFQQIIFLFRDIALVRGLFTHWESKVSSWICSVVSKPRGSRISAFLVSDNFFLTFLLLLARSEDRELLACLLCMISSTWNLPGFGGTSISIELKTVEGTVTKVLGHRMFCVPKKRR